MGKSLKLKTKKTKSYKDKRVLSYHDYDVLEESMGLVYGALDN